MKAKTISHILSCIAIAMVLAGTIYLIVSYVNTKALLEAATTQTEIDNIIKDSTAPFILYVGLNFFLATIIAVTGCLFYAFSDSAKKANAMFFCKIASAVIPMVLLVIYIIIWMTLK